MSDNTPLSSWLKPYFDDMRVLVANSRKRESEYRQEAQEARSPEQRNRLLAYADEQARIVRLFSGMVE